MRTSTDTLATIGVTAGLVGGLAEVLWIGIYAASTDNDAALVARAVTEAVGLGGFTASPVASGMAIHFVLAACLGIAIAFALRPMGKFLNDLGLYLVVISALAVVWTVNFVIVLPLISPQFVYVVPYEVSLVSKLLFGVSAAWLFQLTNLTQSSLRHA